MGPFDPPSTSTLILSSPLIYCLRPLYALLLTRLRPVPKTRLPDQPGIRVVCISDTHNLHETLTGEEDIPEGDVLVHAGDLTDGGTVTELQDALNWLKALPHAHKVVVAGNHDTWLDETRRRYLPQKSTSTSTGTSTGKEEEDDEEGLDWGSIHYLKNTTATLRVGETRSLTIHGIPQIPCLDPSSASVHAFQYPPDDGDGPPYPEPPVSTDILVSHSPAQHHRDVFPSSVGCPYLRSTLWKIRPSLHVHGHAHAGPPGVERVYYDAAQRAWESLLDRRQEGGTLWERGAKGWFWWVFVRGAIWRDAASVFWAWRDVGVVLGGTLWGVLRGCLAPGGRRTGSRGLGKEGWIVNAACMDGGGSGKLTEKATVVEI